MRALFSDNFFSLSLSLFFWFACDITCAHFRLFVSQKLARKYARAHTRNEFPFIHSFIHSNGRSTASGGGKRARCLVGVILLIFQFSLVSTRASSPIAPTNFAPSGTLYRAHTRLLSACCERAHKRTHTHAKHTQNSQPTVLLHLSSVNHLALGGWSFQLLLLLFSFGSQPNRRVLCIWHTKFYVPKITFARALYKASTRARAIETYTNTRALKFVPLLS